MKIAIRPNHQGFSLVEVVFAIAISATILYGTIKGYVSASTMAERSAYNLSAQSCAMQRMEQVHAAKWDTQMYPQVDQMITTNFPPFINTLDIPMRAGGNKTLATTYTTIKTITNSGAVYKSVKCETVWQFNSKFRTNSISTMIASRQ